MTANNVLVDVRDGVARVTLNRPERRNPISEPAMVDDFVTALRRLRQDANVRAVILTGAGTAFSAGGDIFAMADNLERRRSEPLRTVNDYQVGIQRIPEEIERLTVPIIAAVNGPAIGAGCDLACMCDTRLASDKAKFAESFVRLGLIPGDGGAWFLQRVIGYARACELTFTGDTIDAETALSIGLVSAVHPHAELLDRADELAQRIAQNPPDAVRAAKRLIKFARHGSLADTLELSAQPVQLIQTHAGLEIDQHARVISKSGQVVSGLFAAGESGGGVLGKHYVGATSLGNALTMGRIAGRAAARERVSATSQTGAV